MSKSSRLTSGHTRASTFGLRFCELVADVSFRPSAPRGTLLARKAAITPSGTSTQSYTYTGADSTQRTAAGGTTFAPNGTDIYRSTTGGTPSYDIYDSSGDLLGIRTGSTSDYLLHDNIGSIVAVIISTGTISDRYTYDPYGTRTTTTTTTSGVTNPFGYTDSLTGLIKFGTRYYDPTTARWTQLDPSKQDPGYIYAGDNSVNYSDPTGLDCTNPNVKARPPARTTQQLKEETMAEMSVWLHAGSPGDHLCAFY